MSSVTQLTSGRAKRQIQRVYHSSRFRAFNKIIFVFQKNGSEPFLSYKTNIFIIDTQRLSLLFHKRIIKIQTNYIFLPRRNYFEPHTDE